VAGVGIGSQRVELSTDQTTKLERRERRPWPAFSSLHALPSHTRRGDGVILVRSRYARTMEFTFGSWPLVR
jgi:hypothetical protein